MRQRCAATRVGCRLCRNRPADLHVLTVYHVCPQVCFWSPFLDQPRRQCSSLARREFRHDSLLRQRVPVEGGSRNCVLSSFCRCLRLSRLICTFGVWVGSVFNVADKPHALELPTVAQTSNRAVPNVHWQLWMTLFVRLVSLPNVSGTPLVYIALFSRSAPCKLGVAATGVRPPSRLTSVGLCCGSTW